MGYRQALKVLSYTLFVILIVNYASVAAVPGAIHRANAMGENTLAGSWRGILTHKNMTGGLCALTIYVFMFESRQFTRFTRLLVVAAAAYFLYRTQSKTSLGITGIAGFCGILFLGYSPRYRVLMVPVLVSAIAAIVLGLSLYLEPILRQLAASENAFTGRIQIWRVLIDYIGDNPWLGSGYGAFWNIGPTSPVFSRATGWVEHIIIGHSGYLDIAAQIGIPGMILAVAAMMLIPLARIFASPWMPRRTGAMLVALLVFYIGHNFTETSLLERDSLLTVIHALTVAFVYTAIRDGKEAALAGGVQPKSPTWNSMVKRARRR
jgi:O-antigen ligase